MGGGTRAFRFGVQEHSAPNGRAWKDKARLVETIGYKALYLPDHFGEQLAPIAALMAAADATTTLRVGSLVFDNDYRHPVVLAKEVATLDLISDGRFDLGLGAGWMASDYEQSGIPLDPPGVRIERMAEGLAIIKGLLAGGEFSFAGKHYSITSLEGYPSPVQKPHPPIVLGGGGRRILRLAARQADIVNINYNLSEGRLNPALARTGVASATDEKLAWIKEAAGERVDQIELSVTIFFASIADDAETLAAAVGHSLGSDAAEVLDTPHFLIGTVDEIVEALRQRRERYGISYVILPGEVAEAFAPVVERLSGT